MEKNLKNSIMGRRPDLMLHQHIIVIGILTAGMMNQRTIGPVNAHLISWPSKAQNIQNLEIYGKEMTLTFNTHNLFGADGAP